MEKNNIKIVVIGSGIIGLTSALALQESGFSVVIYTKQLPLKTTSAKVGAIWFPYNAEPLNKVNQWSGQSYKEYESHFLIKDSGVYLVPLLVLSSLDSNDDWVKELPENSIRKAKKEELPNGYDSGWIATVPLVEPPTYLPYLRNRFIENGGEIIEKTLHTLENLPELGDIIVNCTGLGAKELCQDNEVYPIRGQILKIESQHLHSMINATQPGALSYIIQRSDCTILGGTDYQNDANETVSTEDTALIISRLIQLKLLPKEPIILEEVVGLRPKRKVIRCEQDKHFPTVFHNYGHGGAGFTTAWGCAKEITEKIKTQIKIQK